MTVTAITYKLLLVPPTAIFAARVNQTSFSDDAAQVTFDTVTTGAYTDIQPEMMVLFGTSAGADDLGRARVRKAATSSVLYFGWASRAVGEGEVYLQDDAYITVLDLYKPWTKNPRITPAGVSYTDYDRDFATYGALPPVVLLGCGAAVQQPLDSVTSKATFTFDASSSYVASSDASAISTWAWTLPSGATLTAGAVNSNTVTFTLAQGAKWCSVVATDDNGTSATRRVLCVAGEPTGSMTKFDRIEISRRVDGQTMTVRLSQTVPESTYPNGCMAVLWKRQTANGVVVTPSGLTGHEHEVFTGWHYQDDTSGRAGETGFLDDTTLEFRDVGGWLQVLPGYPIIIERRSNPANWAGMRQANIDRYFMRLLAEYSNVLTFTDFSWSGQGATYYPFPALASSGSTLYEQVDGRAQAIAHKLTCDQWGRLAVYPDPQLLDNTGGTLTPITRTTTVQKAITEAVWSDVSLPALPFPRANWDRESAVIAEALTVSQISKLKTAFSVAPGNAPSQGTNTVTSGEQLVTDQDELNARAGHRYAARHNNPLPSIDVPLATPDDFAIQPAYMQWVTFTNSSATAGQRQRLYSATRFLPIEVSISHDAERGTQTVTVTAEKEVIGKPAKTYIPPADNSTPIDNYDVPPNDWNYDGDALNLSRGLNKIFTLHKSGEVSYTSNYQTPAAAGGPSYTVDNLSLDGTVLSAVGDPYSPKFMGTGNGVNVWIATTTKIYYVVDICNVGGARSVTAQHTFAAASNYRVLIGERGLQNWLICTSFYASGGTKSCYTTNGSSWTEATITSYTGSASNPTDSWSGCDWKHWWDFRIDEPGAWMVVESNNANAAWVGGTGITFVQNNYPNSMVGGIKLSFDHTGGTITHLYLLYAVPVNFNYAGGGNRVKTYSDASIFARGGAGWSDSDPSGGGTITGETTTASSVIEAWSAWLRFSIEGYPPSSAQTVANGITIIAFGIGGTGTDPYDDTGTASFVPQPTIHVSGKVAGLAYAGAFNAGGTGDLYASTDYGATWAAASTLGHDYGDGLGGALMFPWDDNPSDGRYYWGKFSSSVYSAWTSNGTSNTDITPESGYGPNDPWCWGSCAQNRLVTALLAFNGTYITGYRSIDGGLNWSTIIAAAARAATYTGVAIGDDPNVMWFWGPAGTAYSDTGGTAIDDRKGDMSTSECVLLGGW